MHAHAMNVRHRNLQALIAALGHSSRFRLTLCLLDGERCVGDLAQAIGLSQSCTTRHVQALERAGVVRSHRDGKRVLVGLESDRDGVAQLLEWLGPGAEPAPAEAGPLARPAKVGPARRSSAASPRRSRPTAAPAVRPGPAAVEEPPPLAAPSSGTHAPPDQEPAPFPRRPRETLEDFLL